MTMRLTGRTARWLTFAYFFVAPGITAVLLPWLITGWEVAWADPHVLVLTAGSVLAVVGFIPVADAFVRFAKALGTPFPLAPPPRLVVEGFNRYVRNPMYVGVTVSVAGQALLLGSLALVGYGIVFWAVMASFVRFYEEPSLTRRFGEDYLVYKAAVPAWIPRVPSRIGSSVPR
jgi:protein-S-isoprenylcysteine O-methyltransferase Ste14